MNKQSMTYSIWFGLIAGLLTVILTFVFWSMGILSFTKFRTYFPWIPLAFALILIGGFMVRKQSGGYLEFQDALKYAFGAFIVYELINAILTYLLFVVIDPQLTGKLMDQMIEQTRTMMEKFNVSEDKIDEALEKIAAQPRETTFKQIFLGLGLNLVVSFVEALIVAIIIRKKNPETGLTI